jgi:hypothetical protein
LDNAVALPHNPIENSMTIDPVPMRGQSRAPTKLLQEYVDDFCYTATQSVDNSHIPTIWQAAIHGIHSIFPPPPITNHVDGKESILVKKLAAGDRNFTTKKDLIGFAFNGVKQPVQLPWAKALAYVKETHRMLRRKTVSLNQL